MIKKLIAAALVCTAVDIFAQPFDFQVKTYDWGKPVASFTPDSKAKEFPTICISRKGFMEFVFDSKKGLSKYILMHEIKYINDDRSVEENNKMYFPLEQSQLLLQLKARVIQNGKVVYEAGLNDLISAEENQRKFKMMALKEVAKGSIVETIYAIEMSRSVYDDFYLQNDDYIKDEAFYLITPQRMIFQAKVYNADIKVTDTLYNERRFYYATAKDVLPLEDEKYTFTDANRIRFEFRFKENSESGYKNQHWSDIGRENFEYIYDGFDKNIKDVKKVLSEVGLSKYASVDEKVLAIESHLKANIHYGTEYPPSKTVADILKNKVASEADFTRLLAWCYRAADIKMELVMTCAKSYKRFDPEFESYSYLRNFLFYFPHSKKYINPEDAGSRYGFPPAGFTQQKGLFIKTVKLGDMVNGVSYIAEIEANTEADNQVIEDYKIITDAEVEKVSIKYHRQLKGYSDYGLRAICFYADETYKKELLDNFIKGMAEDAVVKDVKVENFNINNYQDWQKPLDISANIETAFYCEKAGDKVLFKIGDVIGRQEEMYQDKPRQQDINILYAHGYKRSIQLEVPQGYVFKGLDKLNMNIVYNAEDGTKLYGFTSSYKVEGNILTVYGEEYYTQTTFPKSRIETFKKVINAAADFNKITILIEKK